MSEPIDEQRAQFEREFQRWIEDLEAQKEATKRSETLTAEDYEIIINE